MTPADTFNWDAASFFERLTHTNRLAAENDFKFLRVSSLEGFQDSLSDHYSLPALVAVSDVSAGCLSIGGAPSTRRVKTVFMAMRHATDDNREECLATMRELFRQFMSVLILERTRLEEQCVFLDKDITFHEIDKYFCTGCACAYFQISIDTQTDLVYNPDEWQ